MREPLLRAVKHKEWDGLAGGVVWGDKKAEFLEALDANILDSDLSDLKENSPTRTYRYLVDFT